MDVNLRFTFVKIQLFVKQLLNTYFVQDMLFGPKRQKFV